MTANLRIHRANLICLLLASLLLVPAVHAQAPHNPFAFVSTDIPFSASDRAALGRGEVITRSLAAKGNEIAMIVAIATTATSSQLVTLARDIHQYKQGERVRAVGRISAPAAAKDFDALPLGDGELDDLRDCRAGDCGLKLTAAEIASVRASLTKNSSASLATSMLHQLLAERVQRYQRGGLGALTNAADGHDEVAPATAFDTLLSGHAYLPATMPGLAAYLNNGGAPPASVVDHYLYWSGESTGSKLVASVTDLTIARSDAPGTPSVMVFGKQVLATHYFTGSLNLVALSGPADGTRYLVVVNRSRLDVLSGPFRSFIRGTIERRARSAAAVVMADLKRRVEAVR